MSGSSLDFPPYRLDAAQRVWRGLDEVILKPKAAAILWYLANHPRRLVSKDELLRAVWGDTQVSQQTLRSTLRELRRSLEDDAEAPRFIETVHGRGYRFVGRVEIGAEPLGEDAARSINGRSTTGPLVGRLDSLRTLDAALADSLRGSRRVVFVFGEPGIGKTSLVAHFLGELRDRGDVLCTHGQSIGGYGDSESYLPLFDALTRLCRAPSGFRWIEILERRAPTWLSEMPALLAARGESRIRTSAVRVNRDRMLRELGDAIDAICAEQPLALVLEDLHWSDPATLDAIEWIARRTEPSRLLIVGTHRPVPARDNEGRQVRLANLRAELGLHGHCIDLPLGLLTYGDVERYAEQRFPGIDGSVDLAEFVHRKSTGNPLMMVGYTDELVRSARIVETEAGWRFDGDARGIAIPDGVRQMIEYQIDQLAPADQRLLESASVVGVRFDADTLDGLDAASGGADAQLTRVARTHGLIDIDGNECSFAHSLHQEILYERLPSRRRRDLHRRIGLLLEASHLEDTTPVAPELAMHFERGGDDERAIRYLGETAEIAIQRSTHAEARVLLDRAIGMLASLPDGCDRRQLEFGLYAKLGNCLTMTNGYVDPGVREAFARAAELSTGIGDDTPGLMSVLAGLCGFYALRGEHDDAIRIGLQQLDLAGRTGAQYDRVVASLSRAISCFSVGDYDEADRFVRECRSGYDEDLHGPVAKPAATDPGVQCLGHGSLVFAARGKLEEARQWSEESTALALRRSHVPSRVLSLFYAMMLEQLLRNVDAAEAAADRCLELSKEHGFPYYIPAALVTSGWARARRGDAAAGVQQGAIGLSLLRSAGAVLGQPLYCSMLAEAYRDAGDTPAGLEAVDQGLDVVEATGEIASEPSLHWIRGDLLLDHWSAAGSSAPALGEAEACYRKGIEVARRCGAPMQALGPATSLARLLAQTGRNSEAKKLLKQSIAPIAPAPGVPLLNDAMVMFAQM